MALVSLKSQVGDGIKTSSHLCYIYFFPVGAYAAGFGQASCVGQGLHLLLHPADAAVPAEMNIVESLRPAKVHVLAEGEGSL